MSDIVIKAENPGNQCRINGPQAQCKTLREGLVNAVSAPLFQRHALGRLRRKVEKGE